MSYEVFRRKVNALANRVGMRSVRFNNDTEKGKYFANFPDGTTIIGNSASLRVTVKFGSGHQAMAAI